MYKINKRDITINLYFLSIVFIIMILLCIFLIYLSIIYNGATILPIFISLIIIYFCVRSVKKWRKKLEDVKYLEKNGKLVKNLPYDIIIEISVSDGTSTTDYYATVKYKFDNNEVELISRRYANQSEVYNNKYIDLVYDEKNTSNYFLDFNIEEVGGNNE